MLYNKEELVGILIFFYLISRYVKMLPFESNRCLECVRKKNGIEVLDASVSCIIVHYIDVEM